ncbi:YIPF6 [Branchiostoma lanceolatum]|uniref:Protein YIPF n=1 Tax=Branchiostoma lanceolatum TaxID=7740 RepID=A0A8J9ZGY2_BRALA|nr:YIPF6 [Branchiostoma lanceolatum]
MAATSVDVSDVTDQVPLDVEGDITVPGAPPEEDEEDFSTLDEPVKETILRDLKAVGKKFVHVLNPLKGSRSLLREWDLWGPLVLCVMVALLLQGDNAADTGAPQFAEVFVILWVGAVVVTLNSQLLGGQLSFFQSVCVLGYCVLPLSIALIVCRIILAASATQTIVLFAIRFVTVLLGFAWSTFAAMAFLGDSQPVNRKALAVYPIFLFYFIISWMIISHTHSDT